MNEPSRRPLAFSVALHALFVIGLLIVPAGVARQPKKREPVELVLYTPPPAPPAPTLAAPPPPVILPPAQRKSPRPVRQPVEVARLERPPAPPAPPPIEPVRRPIEPAPQPISAPVARHEAPRPRPEVRTGLLGEAPPAPVVASRQERGAPKVGAFVVAKAGAPVTRQPATRVEALGQFGSAAVGEARGESSPRRGQVTDTAFDHGGGVAVAEARPREVKATVTQGGFGAAAGAAIPASQRKEPVNVADTPVEIVSKPKPRYTEAARLLRLEGEVVLEVTFVATGDLRVLRVLDGLGHGLDEAAVEAARKIQFKPARRNGQSVDHTATLRVVFRLA